MKSVIVWAVEHCVDCGGKGNMERLTFVDEDGQVLFDNPAGFPEDVGYTIRELAENEEWGTLDNIAQRLANCEQRLKHYEDLEEQGKLLRLPCAVGDTVYTICSVSPDRHFIHDFKLDELHLALNTIRGTFGKDVFLTKDEAEAALKGAGGCGK